MVAGKGATCRIVFGSRGKPNPARSVVFGNVIRLVGERQPRPAGREALVLRIKPETPIAGEVEGLTRCARERAQQEQHKPQRSQSHLGILIPTRHQTELNPEPGPAALTDTLSPSDGERAGVRGGGAT